MSSWRTMDATSRGPVAQLGARVNGIHEVTGSTPVWSTIPTPCPRAFTGSVESPKALPFNLPSPAS